MDHGRPFSLPAGDILESFDNHPPLILPSSTFHLELGKPIVEPALFEQLSHLQEFIRRLPLSETQDDVEEQVTSSLTLELINTTRSRWQSGNETPWCFYICYWLTLYSSDSDSQGDNQRQPVCDLTFRQSLPGSCPSGGLWPGYLPLPWDRPRPYLPCRADSGPRISWWPEQLWGSPDPEAEESGAAEHPPRTGWPGLPQEPGTGPVLPADATQYPAGYGAGRAGGGFAGGCPPAKER